MGDSFIAAVRSQEGIDKDGKSSSNLSPVLRDVGRGGLKGLDEPSF